MADAIWVRDGNEHRTELQETANGYSGVRWYKVDTDIESAALDASGLPKIGDPWSSQLNKCVVVSRSTKRAGGQWTFVEVNYSEGQRTPVHLDSWTEIRNSIQSEPILIGVTPDGDPRDGFSLIRNGDGTSRLRGVIEYLVHVTYDSTQAMPDLARFNDLTVPCHTNRGQATFPNLYRVSGTQQSLTEDSCLYKGYSIQSTGDFLEVVHTVEIGGVNAFLESWEQKDESGEVIAVASARIYPSAQWDDLWPLN